jgi:hypothetical protein
MRLALQRAEAWLWWHAARAAARGLANGSDGLVRAASAFQDMVGRLDRSDAVPVSLGWLAARVFDAVRSQAADDAAKGGKTDSSFDQYLDLTSDGLRGAVHVIGSIARYASMMRAGHIDHLDAANCAVSDIVNLPAIPEQLDFLQ